MLQAAASFPRRYHGAAIALHWLIAALLVYQFGLGIHLGLAAPGERFTAFQFHKSIGITILVLSLLRLALRLTQPRPAKFGSGLQALAASVVHFLFYAIMIGAPLSGWVIVSTAKVRLPTLLFGVIPLPHLPLDRSVNAPAELAHSVLGWAVPVLVLLHVAGALYHLWLRDEVPGRMIPARRAGLGALAGIILLVAATLLGRFGPVPNLWAGGLVPPPVAEPTAAALPEAAASPEPSPAEEATAPAEEATASADEATGEAQATASDWKIGPESTLGFVTGYGGSAVEGHFTKWNGAIHFGADDLAHSRISVTIDLASAVTGDDDRDATLKADGFFDVATHPTATFTAERFATAGPGRYTATGQLSLHGVTRPARLAFSLKETGNRAVAQGTASLSRLAFGVGSGEWAATDQIPDQVTVRFTIHATRRP